MTSSNRMNKEKKQEKNKEPDEETNDDWCKGKTMKCRRKDRQSKNLMKE